MASDIPGVTIKVNTGTVKGKRKPKGPVRIETPCPSCGHRTLFIGSGGHLVCSWLQCKEPGLERTLDNLREIKRRHEALILAVNGQAHYLTALQNMRQLHADVLGLAGDRMLLETGVTVVLDALRKMGDDQPADVNVVMASAPGQAGNTERHIRDTPGNF